MVGIIALPGGYRGGAVVVWKDIGEPGPPVRSYNEWDPLEEVVVGVVDGAAIPAWHVSLEATMPSAHRDVFRTAGGKPFPPGLVARAAAELDGLASLLEGEGITVTRPAKVDFARPFSTPWWEEPGGLYAAMPRDCLLVVGDLVIEAPMAWRSRYFEQAAFRPLLKDYFRRGARWIAAPKPELRDDFYEHQDSERPGEGDARYVIADTEPTFDAADFLRCGRDLIVQFSNVTNAFGVEWVRRHLDDRFRVHVVEFDDDKPMHIDATIMPLRPGKLLVNPERVRSVPPVFRDWDVLQAPEPAIPADHPLWMSSAWLSMNVLMLDHERVVVEAGELPTLRALEGWGFHPIPCEFRHFNTFGGAFHCATLDVRRRGALQSYL